MSEDPAPPSDAPVVIAVVRSGGIAGIRRQWRVEAEPSDADEWITLIDLCPWDQDADASPGADRFMWSIRAHTPSERRERELPDSALEGPWRTLVEAVRAASTRDPA
ncbi:protealysin inhibitor emfourin [Microbacterium sp. NPDC055599]